MRFIFIFFTFFFSFTANATYEFEECLKENKLIGDPNTNPDIAPTYLCVEGNPVVSQWIYKYLKAESNPEWVKYINDTLNNDDPYCSNPAIKKILYVFNIEIIYKDKNDKVVGRKRVNIDSCNTKSENTEAVIGIGAMLDVISDGAKISAIVPNSPAFNANLKVNDVIIRVNDEPVAGYKLEYIVGKLRGAEKSKVTIEVMRPNESKSLSFSLVREKINSK
jgi:C-terminal processing protease CtpA/Prc